MKELIIYLSIIFVLQKFEMVATYNGGGFSAEAEQALSASSGDVLNEKIIAVGDHIRKIKEDKMPKNQVLAEVNILLKLKEFYKNQTGNPWIPAVVPMPMLKKDPLL